MDEADTHFYLFERGTEPGQTLGTLFRRRHDLVHPKMRRVRMDKGTLMDERFKDFNAEAAAEFLVSVAQAARTPHVIRLATRTASSRA